MVFEVSANLSSKVVSVVQRTALSSLSPRNTTLVVHIIQSGVVRILYTKLRF